MEMKRVKILLSDNERSAELARSLSGKPEWSGEGSIIVCGTGDTAVPSPGDEFLYVTDRSGFERICAAGAECGIWAVVLVAPSEDDLFITSLMSESRLRLIDTGTPHVHTMTAAALHSLNAAWKASLGTETRNRKLVDSFGSLMKALPDIFYVLDQSGRFAYLNDEVRQIGYEPEKLIGKHFTEIIHVEDRPQVSRDAVVARIREAGLGFPETAPKLFDERRSGPRMTRDLAVRILNGRTGEIIYGSVNAYGEPVADSSLSPLFKCEGSVTMGIIHDVTASHLYRRSLEENLAAKELLLREIHHRVRDNLQMVASMAHLREMEIVEASAKEALSDLITQIRSMAMVHEALYQSEQLRGVECSAYFEKLGRLMSDSYSIVGAPVVLSVETDELYLPADTLSYLAMIASELVSNAYRHAFPGNRPGTIRLRFTQDADRALLTVSDDGIGFIPEHAKRQGLEIVEALVSNLEGTIDFTRDGGTLVRVSIPPLRA